MEAVRLQQTCGCCFDATPPPYLCTQLSTRNTGNENLSNQATRRRYVPVCQDIEKQPRPPSRRRNRKHLQPRTIKNASQTATLTPPRGCQSSYCERWLVADSNPSPCSRGAGCYCILSPLPASPSAERKEEQENKKKRPSPQPCHHCTRTLPCNGFFREYEPEGHTEFHTYLMMPPSHLTCQHIVRCCVSSEAAANGSNGVRWERNYESVHIS